MEQQQFERTVLQMVQQQRIDRLTPAAVSQAVGLSLKDAERGLDRMVTTGALELDSDDDGNLFYFVPGLGTAGVFTQGMPSTYQTEAPGSAPSPSYPSNPTNPYGQTSGGPGGGSAGPQGYGSGGNQAWNAPPSGGQPNYGGNPYGTPPQSYGQAPPNTGYGAPSGYAGQGQAPTGGGYQGAPSGYPPGGPPPNPYGAPQQQRGYGQAGYNQQGYAPQGPPPGYGQPGYGSPGYGQPPGYAPGYGHNAMVPVSQTPGRSPVAAAMLGFFPGAGQLYNGQVFKGMMFFCATVLTLSAPPLFLLPMMWGMADAYHTTRRANQNHHYAMLPDHT